MEYPFTFDIRVGGLVAQQLDCVAFIELAAYGDWKIGGILIEECGPEGRSTTLPAGHYLNWPMRAWLKTERKSDIDWEWSQFRETPEYEPEIA